MRYNFQNDHERERAWDYLQQLMDKGATVDIKKVSAKRSLSQNNYFYLLLDAFGIHFGYTQEEAKTVFKRDINPRIFVYEKNGMKFLRSSADLSKSEMTQSIDRFREFSAEQGYPLPAATDQGWLNELANSIEAQARYL